MKPTKKNLLKFEVSVLHWLFDKYIVSYFKMSRTFDKSEPQLEL